MKKIYALITTVLLTTSMAQSQSMWDNFEDQRRANYGFIHGVFIPYNENPDQSGINPSQVAARYIRNAVELFDVILVQATMANVTPYVTGEKTMKMDVWSPAVGKTVQITLENNALAQGPYPQGRHSEYQATTTVANAWETLTFQLTNLPAGGVTADVLNQVVILFDPNSNNGDTYYFDNLRAPEFANPPCDGVTPNPLILNDFECNQNVNFIFSHSGINFQRRVNPDQTGNASSHVARYVRNGGEENDVIIGRFPSGDLNLTSSSLIKLDVWDPTAPTNVIVSLQTVSGDIILAMEATTSVSSQWQTLTFDATPVAGAPDIGQFVILFDPGSNTADEYFFDNFLVDNSSNTLTAEAIAGLHVYPNPSQGNSTFQIDLKESAPVVMTVFDLTGKVLEQKQLGQLPTGMTEWVWNAEGLADGIYFYTLQTGSGHASGKIILKR